ncbi:hypothetical protein, partial [Enterococcus faecium]|uniref:hypothetical protein n=1 Tax=Enterococcus faecium TaxID=1352 RepID=UPI003F528E8A
PWRDQRAPGSERDGPTKNEAQLADVPGPCEGPQTFQCVIREGKCQTIADFAIDDLSYEFRQIRSLA